MDLQEIRRINVKALTDKLGQKRVAEAAGVSASYMSRMLKERKAPDRKGIGEAVAQRIEDGLELPRHYLDVLHGHAKETALADGAKEPPPPYKVPPTMKSAVDVIVASLNGADAVSRQRVASAFDTLTKAPDSPMARDEVIAALEHARSSISASRKRA